MKINNFEDQIRDCVYGYECGYESENVRLILAELIMAAMHDTDLQKEAAKILAENPHTKA